MTARARLLSVVVIVLCGGLGVMSATQTWLSVTLRTGASAPLAVTGSSAITLLTPLSLAVLALGGALSIAGTVLRYAFGVLCLALAAAQGYLTARVAFAHPVTAVAHAVTTATGITGTRPVADLVSDISTTAWPAVALAGWVVLAAVGVLVLATAHRWSASGRRYRTGTRHAAGTGPLDAVDSWDGLSRGEDPTGGDERR